MGRLVTPRRGRLVADAGALAPLAEDERRAVAEMTDFLLKNAENEGRAMTRPEAHQIAVGCALRHRSRPS